MAIATKAHPQGCTGSHRENHLSHNFPKQCWQLGTRCSNMRPADDLALGKLYLGTEGQGFNSTVMVT